MKDIFFEIMKDVLEDRILYGYKAEDTPGPNDIPIGEHELGSKNDVGKEVYEIKEDKE